IFGSSLRDQALALPAYRQEMCERLMNRRCQHGFALRIRAMARAGQFVDHPAGGASANKSEPLCERGTSPGSGPTPLYVRPGPSDARTRVRLFHFAHIEQNAPRSPSPPSRNSRSLQPDAPTIESEHPRGRVSVTTLPGQDRMAVIEVEGLHKSYGPIDAVRGIGLTVEEGEVLAVV